MSERPGVLVLYPTVGAAVWVHDWLCLACCGTEQIAARDAAAAGARTGSFPCPKCGAVHVLNTWVAEPGEPTDLDGEASIGLESELL